MGGSKVNLDGRGLTIGTLVFAVITCILFAIVGVAFGLAAAISCTAEHGVTLVDDDVQATLFTEDKSCSYCSVDQCTDTQCSIQDFGTSLCVDTSGTSPLADEYGTYGCTFADGLA